MEKRSRFTDYFLRRIFCLPQQSLHCTMRHSDALTGRDLSAKDERAAPRCLRARFRAAMTFPSGARDPDRVRAFSFLTADPGRETQRNPTSRAQCRAEVSIILLREHENFAHSWSTSPCCLAFPCPGEQAQGFALPWWICNLVESD